MCKLEIRLAGGGNKTGQHQYYEKRGSPVLEKGSVLHGVQLAKKPASGEQVVNPNNIIYLVFFIK
jgi:hypothetical protein